MHQAYELNARVWRTERAQELGRSATLDDLSDDFLDQLGENGFTWLYLFGLWPTGPQSLAVSRADKQLKSYLSSVLPGFTEDDICGSPLAVSGYTVSEDLGGDAALARLRDRARAAGLSLMLDFIPNHVGLDHPWAVERPDFFVQGSESALAAKPEAWTRVNGRILAHARDPFFPAWRNTLQLDYANPAVHAAVVEEAASVSARCDGLRCDLAMLLLPDVFAATWGRTAPAFWSDCLAKVRSRHPGTVFMAEVYWNREYELQQAGFDFTYDKILYDRLLSGDAESIRAHLRASIDYQRRCVRFLENHNEQRAAARFQNPDHHRGALFVTGMVPGMLLSHHGQEDGRVIHASLPCRRRAAEPGSPAHVQAHHDLLLLLGESARQHGTWQLLAPRDGGGVIACLWQQPAHHSLLVTVNASWQPCNSVLDTAPLAGRDCQISDYLTNGTPVNHSCDQLQREGLRIQLPPWGTKVFRILPQR